MLTNTLSNVSRSSRRLSRTGLLAVQLMAQRHLTQTLGGSRRRALRGRAQQLSGVAGNLAASFGMELHTHGLQPPAHAILVAEPAGYLEAIAIVARIPAMLLVDHPIGRQLGAPLPRWPILGPMATQLGLVADTRNLGLARALRVCGEALEAGVPVLMLSARAFSITGLVASHQVPVIPVAIRVEHAHTRRGRLGIAGRARTRVDLACGGMIGPAALLGAPRRSKTA
ncbi:MAG TPA: hypothetical protein VML75_01725 [Kofleriaceae bacterium]|nr:hypothetical protein [Kofleriaceae bacterium]